MEKSSKISRLGLTFVIPALFSANGPVRAFEPPTTAPNEGAIVAAVSTSSRLKPAVHAVAPDDELLIPEARALINQMGRSDQNWEQVQKNSRYTEGDDRATSLQGSKQKAQNLQVNKQTTTVHTSAPQPHLNIQTPKLPK